MPPLPARVGKDCCQLRTWQAACGPAAPLACTPLPAASAAEESSASSASKQLRTALRTERAPAAGGRRKCSASTALLSQLLRPRGAIGSSVQSVVRCATFSASECDKCRCGASQRRGPKVSSKHPSRATLVKPPTGCYRAQTANDEAPHALFYLQTTAAPEERPSPDTH